jgi:hypothetical protein
MSQNRIVIQDNEGETTGRWFDPSKAQVWEEATRWDGRNHISRATGSQWDHEQLYRTAGGAWIIHRWSQWQGSTPSYTQITPAEAAAWLVRAEEDPPEELEQYVTEAEI